MATNVIRKCGDEIIAVAMTITVLALIFAFSDIVWGLDCSHKPACPPGTTAQDTITCDGCCVNGYSITRPTDKWCCIDGMYLIEGTEICCPVGEHISPDGMCCTSDDSKPCTCEEGYHIVAPFSCCKDGMFLSADVSDCCVSVEGAPCCPSTMEWRIAGGEGHCVPKKPTGVVVR